MNTKSHKEQHPETLLETWMSMASSLAETSLGFMNRADSTPKHNGTGDPKPGSSDSWQAALKSWQSAVSVMSQPDAMESFLRSAASAPEIVSKMARPAFEGLLHLHREWMEKAGRIGQSTVAYNFDNLDQEAFKAWVEVYEKEFQQFLNVPALGLTRVYQEHANRAMDKFNVYQGTLAEFISIVFLPVEKTFKVMQDQLNTMAEQGSLPERFNDLYRMWVKILEGHYMTLYKSPEYNQALVRILDASCDFATARQEILQDALKGLPVPSLRDMDEFYKEIYLLKKRVRELEKRLSGNGENDIQ